MRGAPAVEALRDYARSLREMSDEEVMHIIEKDLEHRAHDQQEDGE